jgi:hypothetical protein
LFSEALFCFFFSFAVDEREGDKKKGEENTSFQSQGARWLASYSSSVFVSSTFFSFVFFFFLVATVGPYRALFTLKAAHLSTPSFYL